MKLGEEERLGEYRDGGVPPPPGCCPTWCPGWCAIISMVMMSILVLVATALISYHVGYNSGQAKRPAPGPGSPDEAPAPVPLYNGAGHAVGGGGDGRSRLVLEAEAQNAARAARQGAERPAAPQQDARHQGANRDAAPRGPAARQQGANRNGATGGPAAPQEGANDVANPEGVPGRPATTYGYGAPQPAPPLFTGDGQRVGEAIAQSSEPIAPEYGANPQGTGGQGAAGGAPAPHQEADGDGAAPAEQPGFQGPGQGDENGRYGSKKSKLLDQPNQRSP